MKVFGSGSDGWTSREQAQLRRCLKRWAKRGDGS